MGQVLSKWEVGRLRMNRVEESTNKGGIFTMAVVSMKQLLEAVSYTHLTLPTN